MRALIATIPGRAALAALAALVAALAILAFAAPRLADQHDTETLDAWLRSEARVAASLAVEGMRSGDTNALDQLAHRFARSAGVRVTFIDRGGVVLGESDEDRATMDNHASRPEVAAALAGSDGASVRFSATVQRDLLYVAVPVRDAERVIGVARTALPVTTLETFASRLVGSVAAVGAAAVALALAIVVLLARAITGPIGRLTAQAEEVAGGGAARFEPGGPDETRRLAQALRRMSRAITGERDAAAEERDRLAVLIDELSDAILIAGSGGQVERANRAAFAIFGADIVGRPLVAVVRDHEVLDAIRSARADSDSVAHVERIDPPRFQRAVARRLAGGELLLVVQELTNVRRLETVRRDFVANVSHELRTPIASLGAMVDALESGALDDPAAARDFVARIRGELDRFALLVEDLLQLSRVESGREPLALQATSPSELLDSAADRVRTLTERAGVRLIVEPARDLPLVTADPDRVAQVFANLLHNATRHTSPGGEIRMTAASNGKLVAFGVRDTGDGIAASDLDRIFERFYKGDRSRASGGTGLGLSIAKHIVEAHGGSIVARSDGPGRGASFVFTLPIAQRYARQGCRPSSLSTTNRIFATRCRTPCGRRATWSRPRTTASARSRCSAKASRISSCWT